MSLRIAPITIGEARGYVRLEHSHLDAPLSGLCAVSVREGDRIACVAILGRPVSRELQAQGCAEVTRVASDGTEHAGSMALGAIRRAGLALGWRRLVSYTLLGEAGTIYRADGWRAVAARGPRTPGAWSCASRDRADAVQPGAKIRWEAGPDALPRSAEVDALVREMVGRVEMVPRTALVPLARSAAAARRAELLARE